MGYISQVREFLCELEAH
ncbi:hypothetical protein RY930_23540 (plasmid) [Aeromonas veronii]|nr:hypothetical protein [Aeromonas veronii]WOE87308.1 hypothetical protein RY930_23540 [Aeromonas veronii]